MAARVDSSPARTNGLSRATPRSTSGTVEVSTSSGSACGSSPWRSRISVATGSGMAAFGAFDQVTEWAPEAITSVDRFQRTVAVELLQGSAVEGA